MTQVSKKIIPVVNYDDLSKAATNILTQDQAAFILAKTPSQYVQTRPGKGGQSFTYVSGSYMKKVLNLMFGWDWDFEIAHSDFNMQAKQVIILGKLTCRTNGKTIVKTQFGRADVKFKKSDGLPLDLGNDYKAAATDALKKCASEIGIAADVYSPKEFKEVNVVGEEKTDLESAISKITEAFEMYQGEDAVELQKMLSEKMLSNELTVDVLRNVGRQIGVEV